MTTLVGSAKGTNTATAPAHAIGDLILVGTTRNASATAPTLPAGYTSIGTKTQGTYSSRAGYKIATSTSDATGTWTNATETIVQIYRPTSGNTAAVGASASGGGTVTPAAYPALTLVDAATSWVAAFGGAKGASTTIENVPTGMTLRQDEIGTGELASFDTNGPVSSWSSVNVAYTGTATDWITWSIEVRDVPGDTWTIPAGVGTMIYSNGNKTAKGNTTDDFVISVTSQTTGKWVFELTATSGAGGTNDFIGLANAPTGTIFVALRADGNVSTNLGTLTTVQGWSGSDTVQIAADLASSLIWFKNVTQGGNWNNSGTADPATGTGGISYSAVTISPAFVFYTTLVKGTETLNTGTSSFAATPPSGFSNWYGSSSTNASPGITGVSCTISAGSLSAGDSSAISGNAVVLSAGVVVDQQASGIVGNAVTAAAGAVAVQGNASPSVTGNLITVAAGSMGPTDGASIAGNAVTAASGVLVGQEAYGSTGSAVIVSLGTLTGSPGDTISGTALSAAAGSLSKEDDHAVVGASVNLAAGALMPSISGVITGVQLTTAAGTISFSGAQSVPIAGTSVSIVLGAFTPSDADGIAGAGVAISAGSLSTLDSATAAGTAVVTHAGSDSVEIDRSLTGAVVAVAAGALAGSDGTILAGSAVICVSGSLAKETDAISASVGLTSYAGGLSAEDDVSLDGVEVTAIAGAILFHRQRKFAGALMI